MTEAIGVDAPDIGWRTCRRGMLVRATLAQNVGTGCAYGGLGVSVLALQHRYNASLGTASIGMSLVVLMMTALGPLVARLIARFGVRAVMSAGVVTSSVGYLALAYAPSMALALAACALLIGPGAAMFAALPPAVLAGGWYPEARGKAMGITYLPILTTFLPLFGVSIIQRYGVASFYTSLAIVHLLLLPLMLGVIDPPAEVQECVDEPVVDSTRGLFRNGIFWLMVLGYAILNGTSLAGSANMLPIVTEYGTSIELGAVLLAVSGGASILGSLLAGYACDRMGAAKTLSLASLGFALAWVLIEATGWEPVLTVSSLLIGVCGAAVFPPITALTAEVFGIDGLAKVLGLLGTMSLPFTFTMSSGAAWLRDTSGSYRPVLAGLTIAGLVAAAIFLWISRHLGRNAGAGGGEGPQCRANAIHAMDEPLRADGDAMTQEGAALSA